RRDRETEAPARDGNEHLVLATQAGVVAVADLDDRGEPGTGRDRHDPAPGDPRAAGHHPVDPQADGAGDVADDGVEAVARLRRTRREVERRRRRGQAVHPAVVPAGRAVDLPGGEDGTAAPAHAQPEPGGRQRHRAPHPLAGHRRNRPTRRRAVRSIRTAEILLCVAMSQRRASGYRDRFAEDAAAERYERVVYAPRSHSSAIWEQQKRLLADLIRRQRRAGRPTSVLDFACGTGRVLQLAEGLADESVGVDVSPAMLAVARRR